MSVQYKDYYALLGVPRTATEPEIKRAFRKLAREHHPDVARDKKRAEEKFKEINEAYEVLGDPAKRRKYDQLGPGWGAGADFNPPPGWNRRRSGRAPGPGSADYEFNFGGTGFSDFFEQVFGGRSAGNAPFGGAAETSFAQRGADIEGDILVTLAEVCSGSVRPVSVRRTVACESCGGTGQRGPRACTVCEGQGRVIKSETYQVKVPAGVLEGQRLRVAGRGQAGAHGGHAGDLFLRVKLARHPDFEVDEHHLIYEAGLAPWEAVLGANIAVPTLTGPVNIKIPAGTQNGQKLRVRGRGLPASGGTSGDLLVVARVEVPPQVTEAERELWEKLAHGSNFNPRD